VCRCLTLLITGHEGYAVALAIGELDPHYEGKSVILAYAGGDPPASSAQLRLVVPAMSTAAAVFAMWR
jgi:hypothetical protein